MFDRRHFLLGSGALLLGAHLPSFASPAAPMSSPRIVFGYPPGGLGSEFGKGCMSILNARTGTTYGFQNVDSHNSRAAAVQVKDGPADGSQLLEVQSTSMVIMPTVYKNLGYDPLLDFSAVASLGESTFSLTLGPAVPANVTRLDHYLEWVQNNPEQRDVGFAMFGSQGHIASLMVAQTKGIPLTPRAYQGTGMLYKDLIAGSLAAGFTSAGSGNATEWASGKIRSIGVTRAQRAAHWLMIPTLAEQGISDMDLNVWYAWYAPAATPGTVTAELRDKAHIMRSSPDFGALLSRLNVAALDLEPAQLAQRVISETASYRALVHNYGIRPLD